MVPSGAGSRLGRENRCTIPVIECRNIHPAKRARMTRNDTPVIFPARKRSNQPSPKYSAANPVQPGVSRSGCGCARQEIFRRAARRRILQSFAVSIHSAGWCSTRVRAPGTSRRRERRDEVGERPSSMSECRPQGPWGARRQVPGLIAGKGGEIFVPVPPPEPSEMGGQVIPNHRRWESLFPSLIYFGAAPSFARSASIGIPEAAGILFDGARHRSIPDMTTAESY